MVSAVQSGMVFLAGMLMAGLATAACAQQPQYPTPTDLPNPYRLAEDWPTLPPSMNSGRWGEVIRVHVHSDGNIWIFHRCFNTVPPGRNLEAVETAFWKYLAFERCRLQIDPAGVPMLPRGSVLS